MRIALTPAALLCALALAACDNTTPGEGAAGGRSDEASLRSGPVCDTTPGEGWVWHDVAGMRCREAEMDTQDQSTGIAVRLSPTNPTDLLIMLDGGGSCFTALTCRRNEPAYYGCSSFQNEFDRPIAQWRFTHGVYATDEPTNPFKDWNVVFVPYCTADFHGGDEEDVLIDGYPGPQDFAGSDNIAAMLDYLGGMEELSGVGRVVFAGVSAGGFGTVMAYGQVAAHFSPLPVHLIDDSGPFLASDAVLTPKLQQIWRRKWDLDDRSNPDGDAAVPPGCGAICSQDEFAPLPQTPPDGNPDDGLENVLAYYAARHPGGRFGLISYTNDCQIRSIFAFGNKVFPEAQYTDTYCANKLNDDVPPDEYLTRFVPQHEFKAALYGLRRLSIASRYENIGSYVIPAPAGGQGHGILGGIGGNRKFYTTMVQTAIGSVAATTWVQDIIDGWPGPLEARHVCSAADPECR